MIAFLLGAGAPLLAVVGSAMLDPLSGNTTEADGQAPSKDKIVLA